MPPTKQSLSKSRVKLLESQLDRLLLTIRSYYISITLSPFTRTRRLHRLSQLTNKAYLLSKELGELTSSIKPRKKLPSLNEMDQETITEPLNTPNK